MTTTPVAAPLPAPRLPDGPRGTIPVDLVVVDMDGTLLDEHGEVPAGLWPMLERMRRHGVLLAPASGRQYATLARTFDAVADGLVFIAENGSYVVRDGAELGSTTLDPAFVPGAVAHLRSLVAAGHDLGVVVCGKRSAYVERTDDAFWTQADRYYARLEAVDDLAAVEDEVLKLAVYDFADAATGAAPELECFRPGHRVVVSNRHWIDVMHPRVHKGAALAQVQEELAIDPARTLVFGDYLNDLEMLDRAHHSFAMANGHPDVLARARWVAPSHREQGVLTVLDRILPA
jgi:Cof subfamily protein (haloacid dehalogenase superfamily)